MIYLCADLSSRAEVLALAEDASAAVPALDILINNAGAGPGPNGAARREGVDGHEYILTINTLAPYLLAECLRPTLARGQQSRVVHVASCGQSPFCFDDPDFKLGYEGLEAYR